MFHQLLGFEFSNLTLLIGVLVSTRILRVTGTNPGGIVGASLLILAFVSSAWWGLSIIAMSIIISLIYKRFYSHIFLGRRPLFIMAGMSIIGMTIIGVILQHYHLIPPSDFNYPLGIILPAIIASVINKQGVKKTYLYLGSAVAITVAIVAVIYTLGLLTGHNYHALDDTLAKRQVLYIDWGVVFSFLSVGLGFALYLLTGVKSAGYIMLPFLAAIFLVSPANFLLIVSLVVVAYIMTAYMRSKSLFFGVERYSFVLVISILLVWTIEYVLLRLTHSFSPFLGTSIFAALSIAVIVNEHILYSVRKTAPLFVVSLACMVLIELAGVQVMQRVFHHTSSLHTGISQLDRR
jgi:hypothetical protein